LKLRVINHVVDRQDGGLMTLLIGDLMWMYTARGCQTLQLAIDRDGCRKITGQASTAHTGHEFERRSIHFVRKL